MMLNHFGEEELESTLLNVVESVTRDGFLTSDIDGEHMTKEVTDEIINRLKVVDEKGIKSEGSRFSKLLQS